MVGEQKFEICGNYYECYPTENYVGVRSLNSGKFERANRGLKTKLRRGVMFFSYGRGASPPAPTSRYMMYSIDQANLRLETHLSHGVAILFK